MNLSYIDSSFLLAILLDEEKQEMAQEYWQNSTRVSSILLKIETLIVLRRTYENKKNKLADDWLGKKKKILDEYLNEVTYMIIDHNIERKIYFQRKLANCRSLDAIHMATAIQFREINNNEKTYLYTFDKTMHSLAKHYRFSTNDV
jgi:predicted nucleic acid-binding protein